jgi:hypothetical protein
VVTVLEFCVSELSDRSLRSVAQPPDRGPGRLNVNIIDLLTAVLAILGSVLSLVTAVIQARTAASIRGRRESMAKVIESDDASGKGGRTGLDS